MKEDKNVHSYYEVYNNGSVVAIYASLEKAQACVAFWSSLFMKKDIRHSFSIIKKNYANGEEVYMGLTRQHE